MIKTQIIKINPLKPERDKIKKAAETIKRGGLVIFPTDTLYGLGADALNKKAINKVFQVKKRPKSKPISINIAYKKDLKKYAKNISPQAKILIKKFWPGALTLIFEKSDIIPNELTGGSPYIGIRIPDNKIARELIKACNTPLTSPSANITGKTPPTSVKQIDADFLSKVNLLIDNGPTNISSFNKASTIIDTTKEKALIIREGIISVKIINKHLK